MITEECKRILKSIDRIELNKIKEYLTLRISESVSKLEKVSPEELLHSQGKIKELRNCLTDIEFIIKPTKVK